MPNEQTEKALDEITRWARELAAGGSPDGGVNITFTNAFLTEGDCTPFVPSGKRGTLHNQPPPQPAPIAFFITGTHGVNQVPLAMEADLNTGTVTLKGTFPEIAPTLEYRLKYLERFAEGGIGKSIVFYSKTDKPSDKAGYISTFTLVIE